jgi:putative ABC transport system permease protein
VNWLKQIFLRRRLYSDLSDEMHQHLAEKIEELVATGMPTKEATAAARREFGNATLIESDSRDVWRWSSVEHFFADIHYALRTLRKNPGFTCVAILTLALGIGANTAIYSVVNAVLFHPLPIREPSRVVVLYDQFPSWNLPRTKVSPLQFLEFSRRTDLFESSGALKPINLNLTGREQAVRLQVMEATSGLFTTLGIDPILGRMFTSNEEARGSAHVALLSQGLWRRLFGGNRSIVGETIKLDGENYEIVGILPENVETLYPHAEAWIPAAFSPESLTEGHRWYVDYTMVARLRRDVSLQQAQAAMKAVTNRFDGEDFTFGVEVRPIVDEQVGDVRGALYILWGAVGLVLLVACSNIANLLLARNLGRSREIAVRAALGASRRRLVTQLLTESLLLSFAGGASGLLLAYAFLAGLTRMAPADLPHLDAIRLDSSVLSFTTAVSFIAAMLFGLIPSALSARTDLARTLKGGGRGPGSSRGGLRLRAVLVTSEIALALVLLAGSGLLLRSFAKILDVEPGFDPANLLTMRVSLPSAIQSNPKQFPAFSNALLDRISAVPGVINASIATGIPFSSDGYNTTFEIRNRQAQSSEPEPHANVTYVTSSYFVTMRIPLVKGRFFNSEDLHYGNWQATGAVRIIDEALAKRFWPTDDPIGAEIGNDGQWATIVGVVGSVHDQDLATAPDGTIYFPGYGGTTLAVRTASDPTPLAGAVGDQVRAINGDVPIYDVETVKDLVAASLERRRFAAALLTLFALLAFMLALIGLYGVVAYLVTERAPEIGLRMALGAQHTDILRLMLTQGLRMALLGVTLGLFSFLLIRPLIASQLFGVGPADLFTLTAASLLLLGMATSATLIPARRAMRVDPMVALRHE